MLPLMSRPCAPRLLLLRALIACALCACGAGACAPDVDEDAEPTCRTFRCDERFAGPQLHEGWTECVTCDEASDACSVELSDDEGAVFSSCSLCASCDDACGDAHREAAVIYCTGSL